MANKRNCRQTLPILATLQKKKLNSWLVNVDLHRYSYLWQKIKGFYFLFSWSMDWFSREHLQENPIFQYMSSENRWFPVKISPNKPIHSVG